MREVTIKAEIRTEFKKSISHQLRKKGKIPGIYYGSGEESIPISVSETVLKPIIFSSESCIINLEIPGKDKPLSCILKDVQYDPIFTNPIHFDLIALREGETIELEVSVILNGTSVGVKNGGILQHSLHKLDIECLPQNIPSHIDIDISNLDIGDSFKVNDLKFEGIKILNDENAAIVNVVPPTVEKVVEEVPTEEEAAEPEVISKGKKEESEEQEQQ